MDGQYLAQRDHYVKAAQRMPGNASAAMALDVNADLFDEDQSAVSDALNRDASEQFAGRT